MTIGQLDANIRDFMERPGKKMATHMRKRPVLVSVTAPKDT